MASASYGASESQGVIDVPASALAKPKLFKGASSVMPIHYVMSTLGAEQELEDAAKQERMMREHFAALSVLQDPAHQQQQTMRQQQARQRRSSAPGFSHAHAADSGTIGARYVPGK